MLIGWSDPRKDAATAAAAHSRVIAAGEEHQLLLVGGSHPSFAPVAVPQLSSIRRVGRVPDDDLVALLSGAEVLLYPSRYEGFGLPPLEALACGTPAVVSDIPVLRETSPAEIRREPVGDVDAWSAALSDGLNQRLARPRPPTRTWAAAGRQLVAALPAGPGPTRCR